MRPADEIIYFLKNFFTQASGRFFFLITKATAIFLLARALGPTDFAIYTLLILTINLVSALGTMGTAQGAIYYFSNNMHTRTLVAFSYVQAMGFGGLLALFLYFIMGYWENLFSYPSVMVKLVTVTTIPCFIMATILSGILVGEGKFSILAVGNIMQWGLNLIIILILFLKGCLTLESVLLINIGTILLTIILYSKTVFQKHIFVFDFNRKIIYGYIAHGFKMFLFEIFLLYSLRFDFYFAKANDSVLNLGYYALITNINEIILQLPRSAYNAIYSQVASSQEIVSDITTFVGRLFFSGMWLWYLMIIVGGPLIIALVGGSQYAGAYQVMILQFPCVPFISLSIVISGFIAGMNRLNSLLGSCVVTTIVMLGTNLILTPRYGIYGAALAKVLASMFFVGVLCHFMERKFSWRATDMLFFKKRDLVKIGEIMANIWRQRKRSSL